jgi:hypothetical protein
MGKIAQITYCAITLCHAVISHLTGVSSKVLKQSVVHGIYTAQTKHDFISDNLGVPPNKKGS